VHGDLQRRGDIPLDNSPSLYSTRSVTGPWWMGGGSAPATDAHWTATAQAGPQRPT